MRYFQSAYRQSEKGLGRTFLYSMVLGLIFAISILVTLMKGMSSIDDSELKKFGNETGCKLVDYQLQCDSDNYEYEGIIIDLNYENSGEYPDQIILTKERIYKQDQSFTYEQALDMIGQTGGDLNIDDVTELFNDLMVIISIVAFIGSFIGGALFFLVSNTLLAAIMILLFKSKANIKFAQMYKLVMFTIAPYVLFNAITRMIFDVTFVGSLTSNIPYVGGIIHVIIDYAIIYGLTYLAINEGKKLPSIVEDVVEENNKVW